MKIFCFGASNGLHNKNQGLPLYNEGAPVVFLKPDSALLKDGKPFFVPDWMGHIDCQAHLAVRICRLGKAIPERFAHRYYDAVTVGLDFTAADLLRQAQADGRPWTMAKSIDASAVIGEWVATDSEWLATDSAAVTLDGTPKGSLPLVDCLLAANREIALLSKTVTMKTGDIIFTGPLYAPVEAAMGSLFEGFIGTERVLTCRCK